MLIDMHEVIMSMLKSLDGVHHVDPADLPDIDLYMDQVTSFLEAKLRNSARNPEEDKILTKTMINNYAKNNLIPSPEKKKYTKEHMLLLIFIYYFKGIMSISDIQTLMKPLGTEYFGNDDGLGLEEIYREVFGMEQNGMDSMKKDVLKKFRKAEATFPDAPEEEREYLTLFSFVCLLSFDIYLKKMLVERIVDNLGELENAKEPENK